MADAMLDVVFVIDGRFEGGVSTAVAAELDEMINGGGNVPSIGILLVKAHLLGWPWPVHPEIRKHIEAGTVRVLRPGEEWRAQLALVHHPAVFANLPRSPLPVRARRAILILHHPLFDNDGNRQYDLEAVEAHISATLAPECLVAPVSPVVRRSLRSHHPKSGEITEEDWINLIRPQDWPFDPDRPTPTPGHVVVGRHARPDAKKWPDTREEAEQIYSADDPGIQVRILGSGPFLAEIYGLPLPTNWVELDFDPDGVPDFLSTLDFYVYYHSSAWSEAFGRTILEALACGIVTILPPHFEELFGPAALYAEPQDVSAYIADLVANPEAWRMQRRKARLWVIQNHATVHRVTNRLKLYGLRDSKPAAPAVLNKPPAPVLFVSTNGIGVGHLTQQLAIADRLPHDVLQPVFASMSFSIKVARDAGYPVFYRPHHKHLEAEPDRWNPIFAEEMFDLIRHLQPALLAYDGTAVFGGLADVMREFPDLTSLWVRRAMWREIHRPFLAHSDLFTGVLEPGELAGQLDYGPTRAERPYVQMVSPVLHIDPDARASREAARAHYGLGQSDLAVALQLGSGANFDTVDLRVEVISRLLRDPRVKILEIVSPLAPMPDAPDDVGDRLLQLREFPSFYNSRALDAAVGVAGYNSFHEQLFGGIPTLFIPNEAAEMDSQLTRAQWAEVMGLGLCVRATHDSGKLDKALKALLDDDTRARLVGAMAYLEKPDGAREIAELVTDYSAMIRTDRWPDEAYAI